MTCQTEWGSYGEPVKLKIRQGATFGPIAATMSQLDTNGVVIGPVDLTGGTIRAKLFKTGQADVNAVVTYPDRVNGQYTWLFTDEQTAGLILTAVEEVWEFVLDFEDSLGTVIPLYNGTAHVLRNSA